MSGNSHQTIGAARRGCCGRAFTAVKTAAGWSWFFLCGTFACAESSPSKASLNLNEEGENQQASGESTLGNLLLSCDSGEECGAVGIGCECQHCTTTCSDDESCLAVLRGEFKDAISANVLEHLRCLGVSPLCAEERHEAEVAAGERGTCELICVDDGECIEFLGPHAICTPAGTCRVPSRQLRCPSGMLRVEGQASQDAGEPLQPFCMSATEITVAQFEGCRQAGSCEATTQGNAFEAQSDSLPIDFITPQQAEAHCEYLGGRLPTLQQWRWAAQNGTYESLYPWGNGFGQADADRVCSLEENKACDVASHPSGDTLTGFADMSGNVAELVSSGDGYCAAGGSFVPATDEMIDADLLQTNSCVAFEEPLDAVGFRCVAEPTVVTGGGT